MDEVIGDTERLKERALQIGFDAVRVTTADAAPRSDRLRVWLDAGLHGEMGYLERRHELRSGALSDARLLKGARSVVMLAVSYAPPERADATADRAEGVGTVARYARGEDYHTILRRRLNELRDWIEAAWPGERARGYTDSGPIRERELAARAGLGWIGKHTGLISLDLGNWFFLAALLTTHEFAPDAAVAEHCGTCTRCIAACPTGALIAPYTMDARRCISYLTIELRGAIPRELRAAVGDRVFGCDDCLAACPWNERAQTGRDAAFAARTADAGHPDLIGWLDLLADEAAFRARFRNSPLLRPGRAGLRRNVCVGLGNVGGPGAVPGLVDALGRDVDAVVRGHAAWALGEIGWRERQYCDDRGTVAVCEVLRAANADEANGTVRQEIGAALLRIGVERPSSPQT